MEVTPNTIVAASLGFNEHFKEPEGSVNDLYVTALKSEDVEEMRINVQFLINSLSQHAAKTLDSLCKLRTYADRIEDILRTFYETSLTELGVTNSDVLAAFQTLTAIQYAEFLELKFKLKHKYGQQVQLPFGEDDFEAQIETVLEGQASEAAAPITDGENQPTEEIKK